MIHGIHGTGGGIGDHLGHGVRLGHGDHPGAGVRLGVGDHPGEDLSVEVVRQWRIGVLPEIVLRHHVRVGHQPRVPVEILLIVSLPDPALPDVRHLVHARVICHRGDQYHVQEVAPVLSIIMAGGNITQVAQQVIVRPAQVS